MSSRKLPSAEAETLIVGAGLAGLACARELSRAGQPALVVEKSRGVGGRCATRRVEGQPVDHGPAFLHGSDPDFLAAIDAVETERPLEGWPVRVRGSGTPCLPRAFYGLDRRVAFSSGINCLAKSLAQGLEILPETRIGSLRPEGGRWEAVDDQGRVWRPRTAVLTLPVPQTLEFLAGAGNGSAELDSIRELLSTMTAFPCLTVIGGYPAEVGGPDWDLLLPEESRILQLISFDSAKRDRPAFPVLVCQALPGWSRRNGGRPREDWAADVLREAGCLAGDWAAKPLWYQAHLWRFARSGTGNELTRPLMATLDEGLRLAVAGEVCSPGGGVEAAFKSGRALARRLIEE